MEKTILLLTYPSSSIFFPQQPRSPVPTLSSQNPPLSSHLRHITHSRYRRWDSNAETFRTQNFKFNQENNDKEEDDEGTGFGEKQRRSWWSDDMPKEVDSASGGLEDLLDSVWIFKVFRSYGWMLPAIIASTLLATGPKAFLMALALPLGQSMLSLAFEKLWGGKQTNPKRKTRTKKKPSARTASNFELEEEEEEEGPGSRKGKRGYQSWVAENDISVDKGSQEEPSFGGWDVLDRQKEFDMRSRKRPARTAGKSQRRTPMEKGKLSRRLGRSDTPLLLRLLIAVFPFLGSWTKML
ncbi:uncharacterized protein LOC132299792 [Cornus florida]|uniref:uncharacterized protein LOC132299792 n=1 Tax=Cornus florida TaxID=4283 RepID=UPI00289B9E57|nr:uncharacterized protein LOC132299792 [Cornus florida]